MLLRRSAATTSGTHPWWRDAVVYQIYVRSFSDANGDGRGDLAGVIERLDYLAELAIDAIWLTPCYPSPQLDHGYDVSDYFDIEPMYGDLSTFDHLVAAARQRGIRVLMDVVPNHCSDRHGWFQAALGSPRGSRERERFWFRDGTGEHGELPPNNWKAVFGGPAWSRITEPDGAAGQWYLHTFTPWQPDFDWHHPDVVELFDAMLRFWFDRGVDGFRVDAVTVVGKEPSLPDAPPAAPGTAETDVWAHNPYTVFWPAAHDYWRHWRALIDAYEDHHPGRSLVTVSEAYTPRRPDLLLSYVQPDQFHQSFCFDLMLSPWHAGLIREAVSSVYDVLSAAGATMTWTLNNHDTQRAVTRYGRADAHLPGSWTGSNLVYTGAPVDLEIGTRRARAMVVFVAALPGSLYLYQGEELGLPEVLDIADDARQDPIFIRTQGREIGRDGCRVALPWTADPADAFGFSPGAGAAVTPWMPQPADWGRWSVSEQVDDRASMLSLYRQLIATRKVLDPLAPLEWLMPESAEVVAFRRGDVTVVMNVSARDVVLPAAMVDRAEPMLSSDAGPWDVVTVPADSCVWLRDG
ncbi:MAG: glycoside hydrolase family 13 protein [Ilumatobacteraceae bacterium]